MLTPNKPAPKPIATTRATMARKRHGRRRALRNKSMARRNTDRPQRTRRTEVGPDGTGARRGQPQQVQKKRQKKGSRVSVQDSRPLFNAKQAPTPGRKRKSLH